MHSALTLGSMDGNDAPPKPEITLRGVILAASVWLAYTLMYALALVNTIGLSFYDAFMSQALLHLLAALCSIPFWWLLIRQMDALPWLWKLGAHLVCAPVYAVGVYHLYIFSIGLIAGRAVQQDIVQNAGVWMELANVLMYIVQFGVFHGVRATQRLRVEQGRSSTFRSLARERELVALRAQVNPHFLFNTLNSISAMVSRDTDETRKMLAQLAELMRYSLDTSERDLVPLHTELNIVRAYLELEHKRLGERLRTRFDIDPETDKLAIPPMLLQPLVENAVKHGIAPLEGGGEILIGIQRRGEHLLCSVRDNGAGLSPNTSVKSVFNSGTGLRNTHRRLRQRFGRGCGLQVESLKPRGFSATLTIPQITVDQAGI